MSRRTRGCLNDFVWVDIVDSVLIEIGRGEYLEGTPRYWAGPRLKLKAARKLAQDLLDAADAVEAKQ